ncbi:hypothetical protein B0T21DRAFT_198619 [Apiosordaria backusii]|uniref:Uncharacterized protein n=1 Tax=Apiosordaria backusii TaxID=314023 RepID=A0AA40BE85_9PEZI|nr:hypothetical protein B0T21DRAFT_198619 [Apiosordaria backusii]
MTRNSTKHPAIHVTILTPFTEQEQDIIICLPESPPIVSEYPHSIPSPDSSSHHIIRCHTMETFPYVSMETTPRLHNLPHKLQLPTPASPTPETGKTLKPTTKEKKAPLCTGASMVP